MNKILIPVLFVLVIHYAQGQALTLADCYAKAEANYPLIRQKELLGKTKEYSIENASKGHLPQLTLGGQATYQSEVTQIPVEMPGVEPLSKDQYKVFAEVSQTLYQGGLVSQRRQSEEVRADAEQRKLDVDLYQVKSRVNELFFGILLFQEQVRQSQLIKDDVRTGLKKLEAAIANGTAIRSSIDVLTAELLRLDQRIIELESASGCYRQMLGMFINRPLEGVELEKPALQTASSSITRPELNLFNIQKRSLDVERSLLTATRQPRIDLFFQGGYGRPGLNMLKNEFSLYYVGGIRFSWAISRYYTFNKEKEILDLRRQSLAVQEETFLFNTDLSLNQQDAEISKLRRLIDVDDEIIALRSRILQTAEVQLEEGVIASSDFIREVNAEDQAKQTKVLHEMQLLLAQAKHRFISGQQ